ncbi:hypothetical protein N7537_010333 [Penicillium hordei]|uniref:F-box domain-containing protein n=1 Tax=Penicillium hordei TaxID=40994 RepID=A0AAD6GYN7_9EURO|nr:uncharacterized protein N7537_010333 [Penicillium hordei]KAJ5593429.1 hypothetical protein N7537_010333 [Penicillium hordei]
MSRIGNLPTELILLIASYLPSESSLAALALSNRSLYRICNPYLYQYNVFHGNSSALYWAAGNGKMDTLQKVVDAGAPLLKEQAKGNLRRQGRRFPQFGVQARRTFREFQPHPIWLAESAGHKNIVRYMIDRGASVNISNPEGHTLLALAAIHGDASQAKYLLDVGAWQGIRSFVGHRPMWIAAFEGHVDVVDVLLSAPKQNGHEPDKKELMTDALFAAVLAAQIPVLQLLFTHGVEVDILARFQDDPLFMAADDGDTDFVPLQIVAPGEEPDLILDHHRPQPRAPLMMAARQGHEELVRMLVPGTASLNRTKALAYAVRCRNREIVEILLQGGASPQFSLSDIPDSSEYREEWVQPLLSAVHSNDPEFVELLLDYGADVNVQSPHQHIQRIDRPFEHALLWAVDEFKESMVKLLLERGADPDTTDMLGQPALTYAIFGQNQVIFRSLLDHGANPYEAKDDCGRKLMGFWPMSESTWRQLQEAEIKWTNEHPC